MKKIILLIITLLWLFSLNNTNANSTTSIIKQESINYSIGNEDWILSNIVNNSLIDTKTSISLISIFSYSINSEEWNITNNSILEDNLDILLIEFWNIKKSIPLEISILWGKSTNSIYVNNNFLTNKWYTKFWICWVENKNDLWLDCYIFDLLDEYKSVKFMNFINIKDNKQYIGKTLFDGDWKFIIDSNVFKLNLDNNTLVKINENWKIWNLINKYFTINWDIKNTKIKVLSNNDWIWNIFVEENNNKKNSYTCNNNICYFINNVWNIRINKNLLNKYNYPQVLRVSKDNKESLLVIWSNLN